MSSQEKQSIVFLVSSILIVGFYCLVVFQRYGDAITSNPNDFSFWGKAFLVLIPVSIVVNIVIMILFHIINKAITDEDLPDISDERDKLIELKAVRNSHWTFIAGFLLSMGSQAAGMQPYVMILTLVLSGFIASWVDEITKIYLYRRGC